MNTGIVYSNGNSKPSKPFYDTTVGYIVIGGGAAVLIIAAGLACMFCRKREDSTSQAYVEFK